MNAPVINVPIAKNELYTPSPISSKPNKTNKLSIYALKVLNKRRTTQLTTELQAVLYTVQEQPN